MTFDVIERSREVEDIVMQGEKRMYYRFRYADFYGGIVTADTIGCNLLCAYCWNFKKNESPQDAKGKFYSPEEVAEKLNILAKKHHVRQVRISGAEPFLGEASARHLVKIATLLKNKKLIIETNGVVLGAFPAICDELKRCKNIDCVRIAVKGHDCGSFERVTGAHGNALEYQIKAIENCRRRGIPCDVAAMPEVVDIQALRSKVSKRIETEPLRYYQGTKNRMVERGIL